MKLIRRRAVLIVGLGNPGEKFSGTRHNLGFEVVDRFARDMANGEWLIDKKFDAEIIKLNYQPQTINHELILVRPQTYMNL